jgi:hypothetical protein
MLPFESLCVEDFMRRCKRAFTERGKIDTSRAQIHDRTLSWHGTGTSVKSAGVKLA